MVDVVFNEPLIKEKKKIVELRRFIPHISKRGKNIYNQFEEKIK